jgi:hypothetical protein
VLQERAQHAVPYNGEKRRAPDQVGMNSARPLPRQEESEERFFASLRMTRMKCTPVRDSFLSPAYRGQARDRVPFDCAPLEARGKQGKRDDRNYQRRGTRRERVRRQ